MTSTLTKVSGQSLQHEQFCKAAMSDLQNAMTRTTQEMAEKRTDDYFIERSSRSGGIINIYYHVLTVRALDATQTLETLLKNCPPKVKEDLILLDAIKMSALRDPVVHLQEAMKAGMRKDVLEKIFHAPTWDTFFPTERKTIQAISDALAEIERRPNKTDNIAQKILPNVIQSKDLPNLDSHSLDRKRKQDQLLDSDIPSDVKSEKKQASLREPEADAELAKKLAAEEQERADEDFARTLAYNEEQSDEEQAALRLAQLQADEELAKRAEAEETALAIQAAIDGDE